MASRLEISLFGQFDIRIDGAPIRKLRSRKGIWLLALLILRNGRETQRDWLAGTLWPDSGEDNALSSLRKTLCDLRGALGTASARILSPKPRTLSLDLAGATVDIVSFDEAVKRGTTGDLETAVSLYRGPMLEACFEEWAEPERRVREQAYLAALESLASHTDVPSELGSTAGYLRRVIDADKFRESAYRSLMEAHAASGDYSAAIHVYRELRAVLRDEINSEPDAQSQSLYQKLRGEARETAVVGLSRRVATAAATIGAAPLPVPLTELIGREQEVTDLRERLGSSRLVTLTGSGGIGKTRLALCVANELQDGFADGARFVDLTAISDAAIVPEVVRQSLGLAQTAIGRDNLEVMKQYLAPRQVLLVLDNCEGLDAACASLVEALLGCSPRMKVLATSRHALGLRGETIFRVPSLALPPDAPERAIERSRLHILEALDFPATRFFLERAYASRGQFELTPAIAQAVVAVCRRLEGIPLAMELAAARVRSLSISEVSERLKADFDLLQGGLAWGVERHQTLRAVFDWSWNLLSPQEQSTLGALSSFAGGWTLDAAEAVTSTGQHTVLDLLTSLVDKSLVVYLPSLEAEDGQSETNDSSRYRLLETVRQFADEKLTGSDSREAVLTRHRDYYLHWAIAARERLSGPHPTYWFDRFEVEHDNLRAAVAWCKSQGDAEEELRFVSALGRFWDTHGHLREGRAHLESAMSRMTAEPPLMLRISVAMQAGWAAQVHADYYAARSHYLRALAMNREAEEPVNDGDIINYLACICASEGKLDEAQLQFEESLSLARSAGLPGALASVLNNFAELENLRDDFALAEAHLTEAASICESTGRTQLLGIVHGNLSDTALRMGRFAEAEVHCLQSMRSLYAAGAFVNVPNTLRQMGVVAVGLGDHERAARLLGAGNTVAKVMEVPLPDVKALEIDRGVSTLRDALGDERFELLYESGTALSLEEAVEFALKEAT